MSNLSCYGLQKYVPVLTKLDGIKSARKKCYFTVTSVFVEWKNKSVFSGYFHGCLKPYFHMGYVPSYGDLEAFAKRR